MIDQPIDAAFERKVARVARQMAYPPTPDMAGELAIRRTRAGLRPAPTARRWALAAALALIAALGALMAVPSARAAVLEFIRIGAVRILVGPPTATPGPTPASERPVTATPQAAAQDTLADFNRLYGGTTLEEARRLFSYPIKLPAYPPDLGEPDRVFRQDFGGEMVILVWLDPADPQRVRLSLHLLSNNMVIYKGEPQVIEAGQVNGQRALWLEGPYPLFVGGLSESNVEFTRLMEGHALVWEEPSTGLTYRLETDAPLEEAIRIAESLAP